jgi:hypothetical protein
LFGADDLNPPASCSPRENQPLTPRHDQRR